MHANEGIDGTIDWLTEEGIEFTHSHKNIGICKAFNRAISLADNPVVGYMNDDMYVLPGWDVNLVNSIPEEHTIWMLSSTMIEPAETRNPCVIVKDFGRSIDAFDETGLLNYHNQISHTNWSGASWPPVFMAKDFWEKIGGFSEEFSPGMYSDPDISRKAWEAGCRYYKGIGASRVYHFQQKSTGRISKNNGRKTFIKKWGITPSAFYKYYLKMGESFDGLSRRSSLSPGLFANRFRCKIINWMS